MLASFAIGHAVEIESRSCFIFVVSGNADGMELDVDAKEVKLDDEPLLLSFDATIAAMTSRMTTAMSTRFPPVLGFVVGLRRPQCGHETASVLISLLHSTQGFSAIAVPQNSSAVSVRNTWTPRSLPTLPTSPSETPCRRICGYDNARSRSVDADFISQKCRFHITAGCVSPSC
jgi:hypothetical protein